MKFLYIFLFSFIFLSCSNKKEIKLPLNDNPGKHEIWNNSPVYILQKVKGSDTLADLKLGQTISTTHWLVAVDKRLKLKRLVDPIEKILHKRHKKSLHSDGTQKAYFTYMDTVEKKVSFVDFDSIELMPDIFTSQSYFKKYYKTDSTITKTYITVNPKEIIIDDSIKLKEPVNKKVLLNTYLRIIANKMNENPNGVYLNFNKEIHFDRFLNYYGFFKNNPPPKGEINRRIFIFE